MIAPESFESKLAGAIAARSLLAHGAPVLVAVSGGADSVALLAGLCALGYQCVAAHCNFHLRGEESNRDMRHVQQLCTALGVDLYVRDFDVESRRKATGESVEMACRELRYAWFADRLDRLRAQAIAVAHHREDNAETLMLNLMRGSGIAGLTGMRWRNGYVVRPMLDFSRCEIEDYLRARGIAWVDDSTNAESEFARNRLRNIVLPLLEQLFPGAIDGILASASHLADNRELYDDCVAGLRAKYQAKTADGAPHPSRGIDLAALLSGEKHPRIILFELLRPLGFNMTHVDNIIASARKSGISFYAGNTVLELDRGMLWERGRAQAREPELAEVSLRADVLSPVHILASDHPVAEFRPERNPMVAYFDIDMLGNGHRFALRRWKRGDRMRPYGMEGSRLLSDMMSDAKYSAEQKRRQWLLLCDDEIIWAIGLRASACYSIKPETRRYLRLEAKLPSCRD